MLLEGLSKSNKNSMTSLGLDAATLRLVAILSGSATYRVKLRPLKPIHFDVARLQCRPL
jgi:hypothetical protein